MFPATIELTSNNEIIVYTKPVWIKVFYGLGGLIGGVIADAIASSKERYRIKLNDVKAFTFENTWNGKPKFVLELNDGNYHEYIFKEHDDLTSNLDIILKKQKESNKDA